MSIWWKLCLAALAFAIAPRAAEAQSWVGDRGRISVGLQTSFQWADKTYEGDLRITGVDAQQARNTLRLDYVPIERLGLEAGLTFLQLDRYTGPQMGRPGVLLAHGDNDDGDWHSSVSDATLAVRYQLLDKGIAATPVLFAKIPVGDYEERGYAATGTGLLELGGGAYVGKLGLFSERIFAQAGYTFTWVQKQDNGGAETEAFNTHYSSGHVDAGYLFGEALTAALVFDVLWTHGGFNLVDIDTTSDEVFEWHDSILQRKAISTGAALGYQVGSSWDLSLAFAAVLWGDNVSNAKTVTLGLSWFYLPE